MTNPIFNGDPDTVTDALGIKRHPLTKERTSKELLTEWLTFAEDVMASCAAGDDWLRGLIARTEAALQQPAHEPEPAMPEELFDVPAVLREVQKCSKGSQRTSAENVSDVLDAVCRLIRMRLDRASETKGDAP